MAEPINPMDLAARRTERADFDPRTLRTRPAQPSREGAQPFSAVLSDAITEVQRLQTEADTSIKQYVSGEVKDVTDAVVAVQKADIAFQTMMQVRNRMVQAYEEILRMQI